MMEFSLSTASGTRQMSENMNKGVAYIPFVGGLLSMAREEKSEMWTVSGTVEEIKKGSISLFLYTT